MTKRIELLEFLKRLREVDPRPVCVKMEYYGNPWAMCATPSGELQVVFPGGERFVLGRDHYFVTMGVTGITFERGVSKDLPSGVILIADY